MKFRTVLFALLFALAISAACAQTNEPAKAAPPAEQDKAAPPAEPPKADTPATPEMPPDAKAFREANRITGGTEKIEALEKFKKDFPDSPMVQSADLSILATLASKMSSQTARIQEFAKTILKGAKDKKEKGSLSAEIADTLLTNKVLLKDAEKYAKASVDSMKQAEFLADQRAQYAKRVTAAGKAGDAIPQAPTDKELTKRFNESFAGRLATLGRIEFELAKTPAALKLLDQAYALDHDQPGAQGTLGEIAVQKGEYAKALEYLIAARLAGEIAPATIDALSSAYSKTHDGTTAGLDELLDAEYRKRFPNPLHLDAYRPTAKRSDRLVLAEVFTGSGCGPCVGADLAFDAAMERYSRKDLAVVMYHQHVPRPDPMSNPDAQARSKYYAVGGVPTYFIDGSAVKYNGAYRDGSKSVYEHIQPLLEKELEAPAEDKIDVKASIDGNSVKVSAEVAAVKSESKDLKVHVLLVEKELRYSGENGIRFHPMVVRAMGGKDDDGFALDPGAPLSMEQVWDLDQVSAGLKTHLDEYEAKGRRGSSFKFIEKKYRIDRGNLAVVVFVQDAKLKHVLQAAFVDLIPPSPHAPVSNSGEPK
jgi:thiol-disulfide isomerase/thioredoxin